MEGLLFPKPGRRKKRKKHARSIIHQTEGTCYLCMLLHGNCRYHTTLHEHHIFGGRNRQKSEEYGLKVKLCVEHHETGKEAVHKNAAVDLILKQIGQKTFEERFSHEMFMVEFGKNYL